MEFPHEKNNGVFKYLYSNSKDYFSHFTVFAQRESSTTYKAENAFDWTSQYWFAGKSLNTNDDVILTFCLEGKRISLSGYELTTSTQNCRPISWEFSASNNNKTWTIPSSVAYNMSSGETYYQEYHPGTYRCFKLQSTGYLEHVNCRTYAFDLSQIELFGTLFNWTIEYQTCNHFHTYYSLFYYIFLFNK